MNNIKLSGIYPITPNYIQSDDEYLEKCFNAISSGINIFQFRSPYFSSRKKRYLLNEIHKYCLDVNVQLIINNDYNLARLYEGSGVHIGKMDLPIKSIRNVIGTEKIIGYSCGAQILDLNHLKENGISYYSIGAFAKSITKTNTEKLGSKTIREYSTYNDLPMCIIGGININNIDTVIDYQPEMIAMCDSIFRQEASKIKLTIMKFKDAINAKN